MSDEEDPLPEQTIRSLLGMRGVSGDAATAFLARMVAAGEIVKVDGGYVKGPAWPHHLLRRRQRPMHRRR